LSGEVTAYEIGSALRLIRGEH